MTAIYRGRLARGGEYGRLALDRGGELLLLCVCNVFWEHMHVVLFCAIVLFDVET